MDIILVKKIFSLKLFSPLFCQLGQTSYAVQHVADASKGTNEFHIWILSICFVHGLVMRDILFPVSRVECPCGGASPTLLLTAAGIVSVGASRLALAPNHRATFAAGFA